MVVSVMLHFPHWTWEKKLERGGKRGGSRERRNKGWHGPRGRTNMCCAVSFSSIPCWDSLEWKTVTDVHTRTQRVTVKRYVERNQTFPTVLCS